MHNNKNNNSENKSYICDIVSAFFQQKRKSLDAWTSDWTRFDQLEKLEGHQVGWIPIHFLFLLYPFPVRPPLLLHPSSFNYSLSYTPLFLSPLILALGGLIEML